MKKLFILVVALIAMASCHEKTKEDLVKDEFMNYVRTDFADPEEFVEITSIKPLDTLNSQCVLETIELLESMPMLMTDWQQAKLKEYKQKFLQDKTCWIEFEVKVRLEQNGRKKIEKYYAIDDGYDIKIQDHRLKMIEAPEPYSDYYEFATDILE